MHYKHLNSDYHERKKIKKLEINNFLLNFLKKNAYIPFNKQKQLFSILTKKLPSRKITIKNICVETALERSVISSFGVSRHVFKKKAANLTYPGIRKSSW